MDEWDKYPWPVKLAAVLLVIMFMAVVGSLAAWVVIHIWS